MSDDNDTVLNTDRETLREGFERYKDGRESKAADKLERLREFLEARFPDDWKGREPDDDEVGVAMRLLSFNHRHIETGEQIFDVLRSCDAIEELTRKLKLELSDQGIAYYLRTTADASDDDDEARLLRDAADVLEHPIL